MIRILAWLLIASGGVILSYNAYQWWGEINIAVHNPKLAMAISDNWADRSKVPSLSKVTVTETKRGPEPRSGEKIGELVIPRLGAILPIVQGTDEEALKKGVGLYKGYGTVKPDHTGHVVLSGHRDTVFRKVGELKIGDRLYINYNGYIYTYQIRKTWITDAEDRTVIVPIDRPVLSLTTCYPFDYIGSAPDRYIIRADLIEIKKNS